MMPREEFISNIQISEPISEWSEPKFKCPKCGGNVRKNNILGRVLTCYPPISQSLYKCDDCDYNEYIAD